MAERINRSKTTEAFWKKVQKTDQCWLWGGGRHSAGYGTTSFHGGKQYAHRVAYELLVGKIPAGLQIDHFRMNEGPRHAPCSRLCVNPAHLEVVTQKENILRGNWTAARNARKTHCPQGHEYDEVNTFRRRGGRECRTCHRDAERIAKRERRHERFPKATRAACNPQRGPEE